MREDGSIALFRYWNRLRNGRPAPRRTEIEPADIKSVLQDTFILEMDTRNEAIFRLAGTRLCAIYGRELKGFAFASLWRQKEQRPASRLVHDVFTERKVVVLDFEAVSRSRRANPFEMLILPLDGGVEHPRCLGIVSSAQKPFWLGADPMVEGRIESVRIIDPDREPLPPDSRVSVDVPALSPDDLYAASPSAPRRVRHLVVLDGGRGA